VSRGAAAAAERRLGLHLAHGSPSQAGFIGGVEATQRGKAAYVTACAHARRGVLEARPGRTPWRGAYDGTALDLVASRSDGKTTYSGGVTAMEGLVGGGLDVTCALDRGDLHYGPLGGVFQGYGVAGGSLGFFDAGRRVGARTNTLASAEAYGGVSVGAQHGDEFSVTVSRRRAATGALMLGTAAFKWLLAFFRIDRTDARELSCQYLVDAATARRLLREQWTGLPGWVINTWRALRGAERLTVGRLDAPERLRVGESMTQEFQSLTGRLASLGAVFLFLGHHRARFESSTLNLARTDSGFRLTLRLDASRSGRLFASLPGGLGADAGTHGPRQETLALTFPPTVTALALYRQLVDALERRRPHAVLRDLVMRLAALRTGDQFEHTILTGHHSSAEVGARVGVFPMSFWSAWMSPGFAFGLARQAQRRAFTLERFDAAGRLTEVRATQARQTELLAGPGGSRVFGASAEVVKRYGGRGLQGCGVVLRTQTALSRASADDITRIIVDPLNAAFGTRLPALLGAGWRSSRDVTTVHVLRATQLRRLGRAEAAGGLTDAAIAEAAARAGCVGASLHGLVGALRATRNLETRAEAVQRFVDATGQAGVAALHHALRSSQLVIDTDCDAYARPQRIVDAARLALGDARLITDPMGARARLRAARNEILNIMDACRADPLLADGRRGALLTQQVTALSALAALQDAVPAAPAHVTLREAADAEGRAALAAQQARLTPAA
jgi:hypothetical protein